MLIFDAFRAPGFLAIVTRLAEEMSAKGRFSIRDSSWDSFMLVIAAKSCTVLLLMQFRTRSSSSSVGDGESSAWYASSLSLSRRLMINGSSLEGGLEMTTGEGGLGSLRPWIKRRLGFF